jgi:glycosyltransferase involved in cell wall biosynthesis
MQTCKNFEVVIINDGSTDDSLSICNEYKLLDYRFKIITQENKGLSGALNTGLENALGEWLLFVDSDDWIELDAISGLVGLINKYPEADLIRSFNRAVDEEGNINGRDIKKEEQLYERGKFLKTDLIGGYISSLFVKRNTVQNNKLKFETSLTIKMDLVFTWYCLLKSENILVNYNIFYNYLIREGSLLELSSYEKVSNSLTAAELVYSYAKKNQPNAIMSVVYEKYLNPQLFDFLTGLVSIYKSKGLIKSPNQIRRVLWRFIKKTNFFPYKMNFKTLSLFSISMIDYRLILAIGK